MENNTDQYPKENYFETQKVLDLRNFTSIPEKQEKKGAKKRVIMFILVFLLMIGAVVGVRANQALENISSKGGTLFEKIVHLLPIDNSFLLKLPIERSVFEEPDTNEKRINYLILSMRGAGDPNGGLLTDSIIVLSVRPSDNKVALISIPRDLYVSMPGTGGGKRKLNEAYEVGAAKFPGKETEYVRSIASEVLGMPIHYAVTVNFKGFKDLVDSVGGVELNLSQPFYEAVPFEEGIISLPAGRQTINGATALLYARARMSTNDFDRSRRQEEIIKALWSKFIKTEVFLNPYRLNKILGIAEKNIKTDMKAWETEETIKLFSNLKSPQISTKVIDNGQEKLLYSSYSSDGAYILLPAGGNWDKTHESVKKIFE